MLFGSMVIALLTGYFRPSLVTSVFLTLTALATAGSWRFMTSRVDGDREDSALTGLFFVVFGLVYAGIALGIGAALHHHGNL